MSSRTFVCFISAFRGGPCISHETPDGITTYCGRNVATAEEVVHDDIITAPREPDCRICNKAAARAKARR